jgi:hypothetical protein
LWDERTVVETIGPRGTVHLFAADDLPTWTAALDAIPRSVAMPLSVRLDDQQTDAVVAALETTLDGEGRTVDELDDVVGRECGGWAVERTMPAFNEQWPRWRQVIGVAAARGTLCFGPNRGRRTTYVNARQWVGPWRPVSAQSALTSVVRDYLQVYSPATSANLAQSLAVPRPWVSELLESMTLDVVEFEGEAAYLNPGDASKGLDSQGVAHKRAGKKLSITVELFGQTNAATRREIDDQAQRVAAVLEARAEVTFGPVKVGAHA